MFPKTRQQMRLSPSEKPGAIMWNPLDEVVRRQKAGEPHGITSVCSAHPLVIEAAIRQVLASGGTVLAEATSNQVDQHGSSTGLRPEDFRERMHGIAVEHGPPLDRVVLGRDHLGPNR
ncbi:class II D-tagatose-bisphosphate aldolase non-catalytic subunit [Streptomyces sp. NPDC059766]|uniref:class II D-tagatose-bisphosphate aldolase non-catalytic subunit n=1 Tax=Streptomyces sp. NPDC059766 TaxID=3346940 RepID=UPI0036676CFE